MDFTRLRTFQVLSQVLHFRRAAEQLGITQPAVSQQVAALEAELGAALFERIGRRVFLTPAGRSLAAEAVKVLAAAARAREVVAAETEARAGRLRVGASTTPGIYLLPAVLGAFRQEFPRVALEFRILNSSRVEALAVANDLDLGVCGRPPEHEELFGVELGQDRIVPVAAPSLAGRSRRLPPEALARWPLIAREPGSATRAAVERRGLVALAPAYELPSPEAILRAAEAGLGVAFVSARAAAEGLAAGRLVELHVRGLEIRRALYAVHHRDKLVTPAMRALMALLREGLREGARTPTGGGATAGRRRQ